MADGETEDSSLFVHGFVLVIAFIEMIAHTQASNFGFGLRDKGTRHTDRCKGTYTYKYGCSGP